MIVRLAAPPMVWRMICLILLGSKNTNNRSIDQQSGSMPAPRINAATGLIYKEIVFAR
jgi:hypothetical protein